VTVPEFVNVAARASNRAFDAAICCAFSDSSDDNADILSLLICPSDDARDAS
jgi:hypothetical protein